MQLLSHGLTLGALPAPAAAPQYRKVLEAPDYVVGLFVALIVVRILGYWLASRVLARRELATLAKAALLCVCQIGFVILVAVAFGVLFTKLPLVKDNAQPALILGGLALLAIVVFFAMPMRIYCIGFWRAFALLLFAGVLESGVVYGFQQVTGLPLVSANQLAALEQATGEGGKFWRRFAAGPPRKPALDEIDRMLDEALDPAAPSKTLAEREAVVVSLQGKLAARKSALPKGDIEAAGNFQRQLDRYLLFLHDVNAERRAQPATGGR